MPTPDDFIDMAEELRDLADLLTAARRGGADTLNDAARMLEGVAIDRLTDGPQRDILMEGRDA